jgi:hypothetical protein
MYFMYRPIFYIKYKQYIVHSDTYNIVLNTIQYPSLLLFQQKKNLTFLDYLNFKHIQNRYPVIIILKPNRTIYLNFQSV